MKSIKLVLLLFAAVALFISGCKKDEPNPPSTGGGGGGSTNTDCCVCDLIGTDYVICEDDYSSEEWEEYMSNWDCDCSVSTAGYNCSDDGCIMVTSDAEHGSLTECENDCGSSGEGYACFDGDCFEVGESGTFATLTECENECGGSSGDCCDCSEIEFLDDEYCDGEFEMGGLSWEQWQANLEAGGCDCN